MPLKPSIDLLGYADFRDYLSALYKDEKACRTSYSYRKFSKDLGLGETNYLHLVLRGKRNLSTDALQKILKNLSLSPKSKRYFEHLVLYNQSEDPLRRASLKEKLEKIAGKKQKVLTSDQEAYFTQWYIPVIRELVALKGAVSNLSWISRKLRPSVDQARVKNALGVLERLGMIRRHKGKWLQTDAHVTSPTEVSSQTLANYQLEQIKLSENALYHPPESRDIAAMTMSLSPEQFEWLKQKLIDFRYEIQQELETIGGESTRVCQLNMQLFGVTKE